MTTRTRAGRILLMSLLVSSMVLLKLLRELRMHTHYQKYLVQLQNITERRFNRTTGLTRSIFPNA